MQINQVSNYNTNFTSKVYVTNYEKSCYCVQDFYNSDHFLKNAKKLDQNGNNDTVVFYTNTHGIYMNVKDKNYVSTSYMIYNPFDDDYYNKTAGINITEAYKECRDDLELKQKYEFRDDIPENLRKYVIS